MSSFRSLADTVSPVRVVLVGAGGMGRNWLRVLEASPDVELVGLVDLNLVAADAAVAEAGLTSVLTGTSLLEVSRQTQAQAVINVTIPAAHHPVNIQALFAGLPVLCEKPVAPTVSEALSLVAAAEVSGELLMISQSRRYYRSLAEFRELIGTIGEVGIVSTDFFKAPHFGGFREEMDHVLLVDMAIHAFDVLRYLLDQEPVSVYCEEFNPAWSWYDGNASASAIFELSDGARYVYNGSWCSDGFETSWNGSWRVNGSKGTVLWDGECSPTVDYAGTEPLPGAAASESVPVDTPEEIAGSLAEFIHALRTGDVPSGEVHENVLSLAMVEAAVRSAETGQRIRFEDILSEAYVAAVAVEKHPKIKDVLAGWNSMGAALR